MSEIDHHARADAVRLATRQALAGVAARLARVLRAGLADADDDNGPGDRELALALDFVDRYLASLPAATATPADHALARLSAAGASPLARDLLLLACLPLEHEGFATLFRLLHAERRGVPSVALALHWLEGETSGDAFALRDRIEDQLSEGPLARLGLMRLAGEGPWHGRDLLPGAGVWAALMARPPRLDGAEWVRGYIGVPGLEGWLAQADTRRALAALDRGLPCLIALVGGDARMRSTRVLALLGAAPSSAMRAHLDGRADARVAAEAYAAAYMQPCALWLDVAAAADGEMRPAARLLDGVDITLPVIASADEARALPELDLPLLRLPVEALAPAARRSLWQSLLPDLGEHAALLAARYPVDPDDARAVAADLLLRRAVRDATLTDPAQALDDVANCLRARAAWHARPGVSRVRPRATWQDLLLPADARAQLEAAVRRITQQLTVLDDWGFAQGRHERRGVRLLLHGAPGTGKSLAAEVMARELGVDLLVVDIASLVSKWIGETEKNLAAVFELAERSRALLLFDEADALFAKRTDTQDARDRYANLETAYLLQRLERYQGVAALTTNLRGNLDAAFARRFEFIVAFPEPDAQARHALWRLHLPAAAPLGDDVDLVELAEWYALSGAQIRNAALAAAFLAAAAASPLRQFHFLRAIEREFDKAGRAHPGYPAGYARPVAESDI